MILSILLTACGSSQSFENYVTSGDYSKAITLYRDKIAGNSGKELEAKRFLETYMQDTLNDYAEGKTENQNAESIFDCLLKIDDELYILNVELGAALEQFTGLQISKEKYEAAVAANQNGDYKRAVELFQEVYELDTQNYESAMTQMKLAYSNYKDELFAASDELVAKGEFKAAHEKLEEASDVLGNDEQYIGKCADVVDAWEDAVIQEASEAFGADKDYESAIRVLQASELLSDAIEAEITYYQEYIPVYLAELEYTQKAHYIAIGANSDVITTDLQGNTYNGAYLIFPTGDSLGSQTAQTEDEAYVNYFLNAEYSNLTGVLYVPYEALSCTSEWKTPTTVKIYGDGVLLYEAPEFKKDTIDPLHIEVNITGVRELKIVMMGVWTEDTTWPGLYTRNPKVCAADFSIRK